MLVRIADQLILDACALHGPEAVYAAACSRMRADHQALPRVGLPDTHSLFEAHRIGRFVIERFGRPILRSATRTKDSIH